jgi:nucleoside phosphorylase
MAPAARLGIVAGLRSEARLFAAASPYPVAAAGGSAARAEAAARALAERGATTLVSVGLAGALVPGLAPGDLILCDAVVLPDGGRVAATPIDLPGTRGAIAGSDAMVTDAAAKAALAARTGALAVDMESHGVARAAAALGLPLVVARVVADPAARAVPPAAQSGMAPDGTTRPLAVALALLRRPQDLPGLLRLAGDAAAGLATLRRVAERLSDPAA